jgi:hypothetical protein
MFAAIIITCHRSRQIDKVDEVARRVCEATFDFYSRHGGRRDEAVHAAWENEFRVAWDIQLSYLSPVFKNPAFAGERERRIIKQVLPFEFSQLKFKQRQSMVSRHMPLCFGARSLQPPRLPLAAVRIGPSKHKAVTEGPAKDSPYRMSPWGCDPSSSQTPSGSPITGGGFSYTLGETH